MPTSRPGRVHIPRPDTSCRTPQGTPDLTAIQRQRGLDPRCPARGEKRCQYADGDEHDCAAALGGPRSVDYISAHQGFTGPHGHPIEIVDALAGMGILPAEWAKTHGEGDALFVVTSEQDIDRAWPRLIAGKPDFVKVFLVHSDEYAARRDNTALTPKHRGLDPVLVPAIVTRAHATGLRVSAHIENAHDFHVAIAAGVDDIAHMPFVGKENPDRYRIDGGDLRAAAARGVSIATTLDWMQEEPTERQLAVARDNFVRMRAAGNTIVIGTDQFRKTARSEADRIASHRLMSNLELLQAWCIATPRAIFPNRKLGRLPTAMRPVSSCSAATPSRTLRARAISSCASNKAIRSSRATRHCHRWAGEADDV